MSKKHIYPIRYVAQQTGLTQHVIRAWEKRYRAVRPFRTETNRRLYSEEDLSRLKLLKQAVSSGHSISQVSDLQKDELSRLIGSDGVAFDLKAAKTSTEAARPPSKKLFESCLHSVVKLDHITLENSLSRAVVEYTRPVLFDEMIVPLLYKIGELWLEGRIKIIHEHMATSIIRSFMWDMLRSTIPPEDAPAIFIATPAGQWHELGALMIAVAAADVGWKAAYFGPNLPAEEIAAAADQLAANLVGLSILYQSEAQSLVKELQKLRRYLPRDTGLMIGGSGASALQKLIDRLGAQKIDSIRQFKQALSRVKATA